MLLRTTRLKQLKTQLRIKILKYKVYLFNLVVFCKTSKIKAKKICQIVPKGLLINLISCLNIMRI